MSSDPLKEAEQIELNRVTTEILARLPHLRVIDKVTVVRGLQHLALIVHAGDASYLERLWQHILSLADLVESLGELPLAVRLRSIVERWRSP
jgi:hypothetical protein